ncbi:MAG: hypothetical protein WB368_15440, partial [Candidatus Sulfotelmatobacter sp.]
FTLFRVVPKLGAMDIFRPNLSGQDGTGILRPLDPRLQPTPDYGTLGPGSDLAPAPVSGSSDSDRRTVSNLRLLHIGAMMASRPALRQTGHKNEKVASACGQNYAHARLRN